MKKKKNLKTSYVIRLVAALLAVFVVASFLVTWVCVERERNNLSDRLWTEGQEIVSELDSLEYSIDENLEEIYGVVMAHNHSVGELIRYSRDGICGVELVHVNDSAEDEYGMQYGEVLDARFNTLTMTYTKNYDFEFADERYAVVLLDSVCTDQQIEDIRSLAKEGAFMEIAQAQGYIHGYLFYPTTLELTAGDNELTIQTDYREDNAEPVKLTEPMLFQAEFTGNMVYPTLEGAGDEYGKNYDIQTRFEDAETGHNENFWFNECCINKDYNVIVYVEQNMWWYCIGQLKTFYIGLFVILLVVGGLLISEFDSIVGTRMKNEQRRRNIMDSLAHEMKTPLAVIRNYSEVLLDGMEGEKEKRFLKNIINETEGLNDSIISVLDLSKMEAGTYPMELSSVSFKEIVDNVMERKSVLFEKKNITVDISVQETERLVVDEKLMGSILINYLSNAAVHTPAGGKVSVTVECKNDQAYIAVRNQGKQIPEKEQIKIWDSFYGKKDSNKNSSGLGLAIVRNVCELHNGECGCENENDGVTFWATINSMEDSIELMEEQTGDIIGVNEYRRLKSFLVFAAAGMVAILETVLDTAWLSAGEAAIYNVLSGVQVILGAIGFFMLFKEGPVSKGTGKRIVLAYSIGTVCVILNTIVLFSYELLWDPLINISGWLLIICKIYLYISLFNIGRTVLMDIGKHYTAGNVKRLQIVCIILLCLNAVLGLPVITLDVWGIVKIASAFSAATALISWIIVFKEYDGVKVSEPDDPVYKISIRPNYDLSGIKVISYGMMMMSLGQFGPGATLDPSALVTDINLWNITAGYQWTLIGVLIVIYGTYLLYKNRICGRKMLVLSVSIFITAAIEFLKQLNEYILATWQVDGRFLDKCISWAPYGFFEAVTLVHYILILVLIFTVFKICKTKMELHKNESEKILMSRLSSISITIYIICVNLLDVVGAFGWAFELSHYEIPLMIIPYSIAAFAWMKVYKKYRKKI